VPVLLGLDHLIAPIQFDGTAGFVFWGEQRLLNGRFIFAAGRFFLIVVRFLIRLGSGFRFISVCIFVGVFIVFEYSSGFETR